MPGLILVRNRSHLERVLAECLRQYNTARPHRGTDHDVPVPPVDITRACTDRVGRIGRIDVLHGLSHEYQQAA